ncbi:hypothetical protein AKO1_013174 [Acrasis kona]|uniref:B30.2/SPRY domain-containing protein n=1 Tax=Acrasis kona TaxID=1008807 RepID=A0AAW2YX04_9EUKA
MLDKSSTMLTPSKQKTNLLPYAISPSSTLSSSKATPQSSKYSSANTSPKSPKKIVHRFDTIIINCPRCYVENYFSLKTDLNDVLVKDVEMEEECHNWESRAPNCANECGKSSEIECLSCGVLCTQCSDQVHSNPLFAKHIRVALDDHLTYNCTRHPEQIFEYYDKHEDKLLCKVCLDVNQYKQKDCVPIDDYGQQCRKYLSQLQTTLHTELISIDDDVEVVKRTIEKLHENDRECEMYIYSVWELVINAIEEKRSKMLSESKATIREKIFKLHKQSKGLELLRSQLQAHEGTITNSLKGNAKVAAVCKQRCSALAKIQWEDLRSEPCTVSTTNLKIDVEPLLQRIATTGVMNESPKVTGRFKFSQKFIKTTPPKWAMLVASPSLTKVVNFFTIRIDTLKKRGDNWDVSIGITTEKYDRTDTTALVGYNTHSWGLMTEGCKMYDSHAVVYGPELEEGDTVTILLHYDSASLEFIVNDTSLGIAYRNIPVHKAIYPAISSICDDFKFTVE